jgi:hypothetical protein
MIEARVTVVLTVTVTVTVTVTGNLLNTKVLTLASTQLLVSQPVQSPWPTTCSVGHQALSRAPRALPGEHQPLLPDTHPTAGGEVVGFPKL